MAHGALEGGHHHAKLCGDVAHGRLLVVVAGRQPPGVGKSSAVLPGTGGPGRDWAKPYADATSCRRPGETYPPSGAKICDRLHPGSA
jgi:hypothetical protein